MSSVTDQSTADPVEIPVLGLYLQFCSVRELTQSDRFTSGSAITGQLHPK